MVAARVMTSSPQASRSRPARSRQRVAGRGRELEQHLVHTLVVVDGAHAAAAIASVTRWRHERALLNLFAPSPDHTADPGDSECVCSGESGRVGRRGETQRQLFSSMGSVSEVRPPGGGCCVPGGRAGMARLGRSARRTSVTYRTAPRGATSTAATPLAQSTTSRSPCRQRRTPEASDSVETTWSITSPWLPASRSSYVTSMLSPLISRTRSTTASMFRTLDRT
jgi:hypothetical protein